jgi:hypothetical protein
MTDEITFTKEEFKTITRTEEKVDAIDRKLDAFLEAHNVCKAATESRFKPLEDDLQNRIGGEKRTALITTGICAIFGVIYYLVYIKKELFP